MHFGSSSGLVDSFVVRASRHSDHIVGNVSYSFRNNRRELLATLQVDLNSSPSCHSLQPPAHTLRSFAGNVQDNAAAVQCHGGGGAPGVCHSIVVDADHGAQAQQWSQGKDSLVVCAHVVVVLVAQAIEAGAIGVSTLVAASLLDWSGLARTLNGCVTYSPVIPCNMCRTW